MDNEQSEKHDLVNEIREMIDTDPLYNNPDFVHFLCERLDEAESVRDAALARAEAAERRVAELEEGIKAIDNAVEIQCHDGNWNYDSYMHGMANGLLLAQTYMAHPVGTYDSEHYKPLSAPERWLSDS